MQGGSIAVQCGRVTREENVDERWKGEKEGERERINM